MVPRKYAQLLCVSQLNNILFVSSQNHYLLPGRLQWNSSNNDHWVSPAYLYIHATLPFLYLLLSVTPIEACNNPILLSINLCAVCICLVFLTRM